MTVTGFTVLSDNLPGKDRRTGTGSVTLNMILKIHWQVAELFMDSGLSEKLACF